MVDWKKARKQTESTEEKIYPNGSCVILFGQLPLTIMLPPGTLKEQKQILKERIKANSDAIQEQGLWQNDPPISDEELNQLVKKAKIKHGEHDKEIEAYKKHFRIEENPSYSRELNKETFELLSENAKKNSWEHTRVYGTFNQPGLNRYAVEINAMWSNVCNVTRLLDDERLEVPTNDIIPAGQPGSLMMLKERVEEYEKRHGLT